LPVDFVGREVEVSLSDDAVPLPLAFKLGPREYKVAEQLATWEDRGAPPRGRAWQPQQRRRYYRVRTDSGDIYELYADWSPARRGKKGAQGTRWFLHRRLSPAAAASPPEPSAPAEEPAPPEPPAESAPAAPPSDSPA
jgi:hypothetical protein